MPPRPGLDQSRVVAAAIELLNDEGSENLTLHRLADKLGVRPPSLYNHIDGLPGLYRELALVNAQAMGEYMAQSAIGRSGPDALAAVAQAYRAYIKKNPGLYLATLQASNKQQPSDPELAAAEERTVEIVLAVLAPFGLQGEDALHAVRGLRSVVHGFTTLEISGGFGLPLNLDESFNRLVAILVHGLEKEASKR